MIVADEPTAQQYKRLARKAQVVYTLGSVVVSGLTIPYWPWPNGEVAVPYRGWLGLSLSQSSNIRVGCAALGAVPLLVGVETLIVMAVPNGFLTRIEPRGKPFFFGAVTGESHG